jgi:glycosyltransferase involved in cell wall biosynthesis
MPSTPPRVSVIIPTTRRPRLVARAVASVLAQTVADLEVIVVVDGPNPETLEELGRIGDPRLRIVRNAKPIGPGMSRNAGAATARAPWIAFLDDDDEWLPAKLERQLAFAGPDPDKVPDPDPDPDKVIVTCLTRAVTPITEYIWPRRIYDGSLPIDEYLIDRRSLFKGDAFFQTSSLLLSRRLFASLRFQQARQHEDWDLAIRAVKLHGARLVTVPEALTVHYTEDHRDSASASFPWRASLNWLDGMGPLVGRRAYSGFCLTVLSAQPAKDGDITAFFVLLARAFGRGAPTPFQLAMYLLIWGVPMGLRQRLRGLMQRATGSKPDRLIEKTEIRSGG